MKFPVGFHRPFDARMRLAQDSISAVFRRRSEECAPKQEGNAPTVEEAKAFLTMPRLVFSTWETKRSALPGFRKIYHRRHESDCCGRGPGAKHA